MRATSTLALQPRGSPGGTTDHAANSTKRFAFSRFAARDSELDHAADGDGGIAMRNTDASRTCMLLHESNETAAGIARACDAAARRRAGPGAR